MLGNDKTISPYELQKRVENMMKDYDRKIEERRTKLKDILAQEERYFMSETVRLAQIASEEVFLKKKIRTEEIRAKREAERLELVKKKMFQHELEKYAPSVIPHILKRRTRETKECNKMQIIEKVSKKRAEKELDHFWYQLLVKETEEMNARDKQDQLHHRMSMRHNMECWAIQIRDHEREKQDREREIKEEAIRLDNIKEELRREEIAALDEKRRKRDELYRDLVRQVNERQAVLAKEKCEEMEYHQLMRDLQDAEIERERPRDQRARLRREMEQYMDYIRRLEEERLNEERQINDLIEAELREIIRKQDEARCNIIKAREYLEKECRLGRDMQVEYKRQQAEEELNMQKAENQLIRMAQEHNERLRAEYNRQQLLAKQKYESDLKEQMKYKILKQEREKAELDRLLKLGEAREREYEHQVKAYLAMPLEFGADRDRKILFSAVHPFKQVINSEKCPCPKTLYS